MMKGNIQLNSNSIIRGGLAIRDGTHVLKVYDHLPLKPYLKLVLDRDKVTSPNDDQVWTPKLFMEEANRKFMGVVSG